MSLNLLELVKGQIQGAVADQIGRKLGLDDGAAKSGIAAALPTLLGGVIKQASTPSGANTLGRMLEGDQYDGGLLENLTESLTGDEGPSFLETLGKSTIANLFGGQSGSVVGALAKATGIGSDNSSSLLAMLAPLVMSILGKQKRSQGLDAQGLAGFLMDQKDLVQESLPAEISETLGVNQSRSERLSSPPPHHVRPVQREQSAAANLLKLAIPALAFLALGFLGYKMLNGPDAADVNEDRVTVMKPEVDDFNVDLNASELIPSEFTGRLTGVFDGYRKTFSEITDETSAREAVEKLGEYNDQVDGMSSMLGKLPESARSGIADQVTGFLEPIQSMIDKLYAIPGVKPILEPVVIGMMDKLKMLTEA